MSFRTAEPNLKDVLADIHNGIIQLPDFQREWVWDDRHILELIASVSLSFPIGAVMFLEAGGVPFQTRLFEGVELSPAPAPKKLVLDGQQRLTSMYLALYSGKPVKTKTDKGEKAQRVYFLDMENALIRMSTGKTPLFPFPRNSSSPATSDEKSNWIFPPRNSST